MKRKIVVVSALLTSLLICFAGYKLVERNVIIDIFESVMERYEEVYRIAYGVGVKFNKEEIKDENGKQYFVLQEEKYTSVEDIKNLLESVLTQGYINDGMHWVIGKPNAFYKEIADVLCIAHADVIGLGIPTEICSIESKDDNKIVLIATNGERLYQLTLLKIENQWFIDDIVFGEKGKFGGD